MDKINTVLAVALTLAMCIGAVSVVFSDNDQQSETQSIGTTMYPENMDGYGADLNDLYENNFSFNDNVAETVVSDVQALGAKEVYSVNINISIVGEGTVEVNNVKYSDGDTFPFIDGQVTVNFKLLPAPGWKSESAVLNGDSMALGGDSFPLDFSSVDGKDPSDLVVTFTQLEKHDVLVTANPADKGTVSPDKIQLAKGETTDVMVTPIEGYQIKEVKFNDQAITATEGKYTITGTGEAATLNVTFEVIPPQTFPVTVNVGEHGTANPTSMEMSATDKKELTITPDEGYQVGSVKVDGKDISPTDTIWVISGTGAPITVDVTFIPKEYTITIDSTNGTVDAGTSFSLAPGTTKDLTITPNEGFTVSKVTYDGTEVTAADGKYTITGVDHDASFSVEYTAIKFPVTVNIDPADKGTASQDAIQLAKGETADISLTPVEGYQVKEVKFNDQVITATEGKYTITGTGAASTLNVTFEVIPPQTFPVTVNVGEHGTANPTSMEMSATDKKELTITPDEGYQVGSVKVDGVEISPTDTIWVISGTGAPITVDVTFVPTEYTVTVDSASGTVDAGDSFKLAAGATMDVVITPNEGFTVSKVTYDDVEVTAADGKYTITGVDHDATLSVEYTAVEPQKFSVIVNFNPLDGGTVTPNTISIAKDETAEVTVTPNEGYQIKEVKFNDQVITATDGKYVITGTGANATLKVTFEEIPPQEYTVTVDAGDNGIVDVGDSFKLAVGATKDMVITPNEGFTISKVTYDGAEVTAADGKYTITGVDHDATLSVEYTAVEPQKFSVIVNFNPIDAGKVTPNTISIAKGETVDVTATPNEGYQVKEVKFNDQVITATDGKYTITGTGANATLKVTFEEIPPQEYTVTVDSASGIVDAGTSFKLAVGATKDIMITPNEGFTISKVTYDDVEVTATNDKYTITGVDHDAELSVEYAAVKFNVAVTFDPTDKGTVSPETIQLAKDETSEVTITPADGYQIKEVKFNDQVITATDDKYTITGTGADSTLNVALELIPPKEYTVTVDSENGTVDAGTSFKLAVDATKDLTITPNDGFTVSKVTYDGKEITATDDKYTITGVDHDATLSVEYTAVEPQKFQVIVNYSPIDAGKVTPNTISIAKDETADVTVTPNEGYQIKEVKFNDQVITATDGKYTITGTGEKATLKVTFEEMPPQEYTVTVDVGENGAVDVGDSFKLAVDATKDLTVTPNEGFKVSKVTYDNVEVTATDGKYTITGADHDATLSVEFIADEPQKFPVTVNINPADAGVVTPEDITLAKDETTEVTITPNEGYQIKEVKFNDQVITATDGKYTITGTDAAMELDVNFAAESVSIGTAVNLNIVGDGTVEPNADVILAEGATQEYVITPADGYEINKVTFNGTELNVVDNKVTVTGVDGPMELDVEFAAESVDVGTAVTLNVTGNGTVEPNADVILAEGATQEYVITPDDGYEIKAVTFNGNELKVVDNKVTVTGVNEPMELDVEFAAVDDGGNPPVEDTTYEMNVSVVGNGTVDPSGKTTVDEGGKFSWKMIPDENSEIDHVTMNGVDITSTVQIDPNDQDNGSFTIQYVERDCNIVVYFVDKVYVEVDTSEGGNVSGEGYYEVGDTVTLTEDPNDGYEFEKWVSDDGQEIFDSSVTFTAEENVHYSLYFEATDSGGSDDSGIDLSTGEIIAVTVAAVLCIAVVAGIFLIRRR